MRIAHITDLHVLSLEGTSARDFLNKRWIGGLNVAINRGKKHSAELLAAAIDDILAQGFEHVVITGDLTNLSLQSEFELARKMIERLGGPDRVTIIPGNHDAYTQEAASERRFERCFDAWMPSVPGWPFVRELGEVALVAVSTAVPTPWGFATGRVGNDQRAKLEAVLAVAGKQKKFRLVAMHHPPVKARGSVLRQLTDREVVARSLVEYGCELVVHGHDHRNLRNQLAGQNGPIPVYGAPSTTYTDERPDRRARYNVYTIQGGLLHSVESREVPRPA